MIEIELPQKASPAGHAGFGLRYGKGNPVFKEFGKAKNAGARPVKFPRDIRKSDDYIRSMSFTSFYASRFYAYRCPQRMRVRA